MENNISVNKKSESDRPDFNLCFMIGGFGGFNIGFGVTIIALMYYGFEIAISIGLISGIVCGIIMGFILRYI